MEKTDDHWILLFFWSEKLQHTRQRQLQLNYVRRILQSFIFVPEFDTQLAEFWT